MNKKSAVAEAAESEQEQVILEPAQQASQQLLEIRDLLFGEQLRAVHQREDEMEVSLQKKLQEMNDSFSEAIRELRQEFNEQLSQHKQQTTLQFNALTEQLQKTREELVASDADLKSQMQQELEQLRQVVQ